MKTPFEMKNSALKMSAKSGSPMQANYASPVKGKLWDALKKGDFKGAGKTLKHEAKGIGAGLSMALEDNYNTTSNATDITNAYKYAKNKSANKEKKLKAERDAKAKKHKGSKGDRSKGYTGI
jgi:hypothetical protein